jgi:deoxyhypusine synthase
MSEAWYDELPDDAFKTEIDQVYEQASAKIREGLAQGLDFDSACSAIDVEDEELRKNIIEDMLKVLIAEEHFTNSLPLEELAKKLKVSQERLEAAKASMLEDVKNESIKSIYKGPGLS